MQVLRRVPASSTDDDGGALLIPLQDGAGTDTEATPHLGGNGDLALRGDPRMGKRHDAEYPGTVWLSTQSVALVGRTPGISCEAVPASGRAGAGMRRHVHSGDHAAESFVRLIPCSTAKQPLPGD